MDSDLPKPTPAARERIAALLIVYLSGIQNGPGLKDEEWAAAQEMKDRLNAELP